MRTKLFFLSSILVLALALSACGTTNQPDHTLSVTGTGTVYLAPDTAYINIGVHTEMPDLAQALATNNTQVQAVVTALKNSGVDPKDIQTSNFSVYTNQSFDTAGMPSGTKYSVDNSVYVTVRDLTKLGDLLNTVVGAGANSIYNISFDVSDKTAAMTEARLKAMKDASTLAGELAQTANVNLGGIVNITYTQTSAPYYGYGMGGGGGKSGGEAASINPGQIQITASVNVTYNLK